jgi:hypothetical protein
MSASNQVAKLQDQVITRERERERGHSQRREIESIREKQGEKEK